MSDQLVRDQVRLYVTDVTPAHLPSFAGVAVRQRRRRVRRALATVATVVVVVAGVTVGTFAARGPSSAPVVGGGDLAAQLVGSSWRLTSLSVDGKAVAVPASLDWALTLGADGFLGSDGCNGQSGSLSYQRTTIRLGSGTSTLVGCPTDERPWEQAFQVLESGPATVAVSGDTLTLAVGNEVLTLAAQGKPGPATPPSTAPTSSSTSPAVVSTPSVTPAAGAPAGLGNVKWFLESWTSEGVTSAAAAGPQAPWMQFDPERVMASDGCNGYSSSVTYQGSTIRPGVGGQSTYAECAGDPQAVGNVYLRLLAHPVTVFVHESGERVTLSGDNLSLSLHRDTGVPLPPAALSLVGRTWKLQSVQAPGTDWRALGASHATLILSSWGYQASDGCSSQGGDVAFDPTGRVLSFGGGESSAGICDYAAPGPTPGLLPPAAYFTALDGRATAQLTGTTLTLTSGHVLLTFTS